MKSANLNVQYPVNLLPSLEVTNETTFVNRNLFEQLVEKETKIAVVGLGYVGLPLALHVASKYSVVGFDINQGKINSLNEGHDPCEEAADEEFLDKDITFHATSEALEGAKFFIVAVPTPVDSNATPNLNPLKSATRTVAPYLTKGSIVVFESTVYPGCTEEECVPLLEELSGLKYNEDFFVGYSPERINPGDTQNTFATIKKIVSGSTIDALNIITQVYASVVTAGVHRAPSIKVAEAAKVVENTQRDVNIALMNELSYIFDKLDVSIHEVLEAAGTKWNFLKFFPGLVGGHCIGVDPYYLIHKAQAVGASSNLIESSRAVNEDMSLFIAEKMVRELMQLNKSNAETRILVKGMTFKENVKDVRNSKVVDLIKRLQKMGYDVVIEDPYAEAEDVIHEYGFELTNESDIKGTFDAVVFAVNHDAYHQMRSYDLNKLLAPSAFVMDIRGTFEYLVTSNKYLTI